MRKSLFLTTSIALLSGIILAQNGNNWTVNGNNTSNSSFLGTLNNSPLVFRVNNANAGRFKPNGNFLLNNFQGANSGLVYSDQNGELFKLNFNNNGQVLFDNGTWGSIPAAPQLWASATNPNDVYNKTLGFVGIGTSNPSYNLDVNGDFRMNGKFINPAWSGGGNRVLMSNAGGSVSPLGIGNPTDVLYGNGIWAPLPTALWSIDPASGEMYNTSAAGTNINGATRFGGSITATALAGVGDRSVYVDAGGNLKVGSVVATGNACVPGSPTWVLGGNLLNGFSMPGNDGAIGTCDFADFVLKANDIPSIWVKPSGRVGLGTSSPQESFQIGDRFTFHNGGVKYIGYNSFWNGSSNERLVTDFANAIAMGNGDISFNVAPSGAAGSTFTFVNAMQIKNDGKVGIGTTFPQAQLDITNGANSIRIFGNAAGDIQSTTSFRPHFATGTDFGVYEGNPGGGGVHQMSVKNGNFFFGHHPGFASSTFNFNQLNKTSVVTIAAYGQDPLNAAKANESKLTLTNVYGAVELAQDGDGAGRLKWGTSNLMYFKGESILIGEPDATNSTYGPLDINTKLTISCKTPNGYTGFPLKIINPTIAGAEKTVFEVLQNGTTHIGQTIPQGTHANAKLSVDGKLVAQEIYVTSPLNWADYVFDKNYKLMPILQVEEFIHQNAHLPNVPSAEEVKEKGLDAGEMLTKQMEKIEEMTLYLIEMKKEILELKLENEKLKQEVKELEK